MLTERQRMIMTAIVDDYIRSAEPVGSRSISKRGDIAFSPATIRNEMSDLEEMGYLEQPHTSAGRIPSNKGYRYYVDHLVKYGTLSGHELNVMKVFFAEKIQEMEQIFQQIASVLSHLTNYTSIVLGPEVFSATLKHLQIIPLDEQSGVAIIVTNTGHVENKVIRFPEGITAADIEKTVHILNAKLKNVPLLQLRARLYNEISEELTRYVNGCEELVKALETAIDTDEQDRIYMSGTTNMLIQPEFKDVDKLKHLLDLLGETPTIARLLTSIPEGIQVRIGTENSLDAIADCSLITASYSLGGQNLGTIGILGPTRMDYARVLSLLDHLSKDMAVLLGRWYK
ncbi:heat-inducible transcription repressor HrcA [Paenibacillus sp. J31TS4]|uniref:heat-inducible transcriptional repressor HrcA n=1 Tax=Paenibacillus sp. J31TS4 TaxID=2807195 RepID=UPI001B0702C8|nr:heat-inducible transcriptional repressor HrcA [Paenibacillus sp. J31TS4]GIP39579.1 heat-inducible transcription repressor HrcA [Paenibacillus sp. J31TS4]